MSRLLFSAGMLVLAGAILYLVVWDIFRGGADYELVKTALTVGGGGLAGGAVVWVLGRVTAGMVGRSCPRCRRRVNRGQIYCEAHLTQAIDEYRDEERRRGG